MIRTSLARSLAEVLCRQPLSLSAARRFPAFLPRCSSPALVFPTFLPRFVFPRFSSPLGWPRRASLAWSPRLMASPVLSHLGGLNWLKSPVLPRLSCLACGPVICFCIAPPFLLSFFFFFCAYYTKQPIPKLVHQRLFFVILQVFYNRSSHQHE